MVSKLSEFNICRRFIALLPVLSFICWEAASAEGLNIMVRSLEKRGVDSLAAKMVAAEPSEFRMRSMGQAY
jgi:hypothetical protein